jgi:hypothetical protein
MPNAAPSIISSIVSSTVPMEARCSANVNVTYSAVCIEVYAR